MPTQAGTRASAKSIKEEPTNQRVGSDDQI
jgi:hypothetical protein